MISYSASIRLNAVPPHGCGVERYICFSGDPCGYNNPISRSEKSQVRLMDLSKEHRMASFRFANLLRYVPQPKSPQILCLKRGSENQLKQIALIFRGYDGQVY